MMTLRSLPLSVLFGLAWTNQAAAFFHGDSTAIRTGETLYAQNCASCHDAGLEGQADWRSPGPDGKYPAPPHDATGHTWHHADRVLTDYVTLGGAAALAKSGVSFDSGMPGFGDILTPEEIADILAYIKSTWPSEQQAFQQERSRADTP